MNQVSMINYVENVSNFAFTWAHSMLTADQMLCRTFDTISEPQLQIITVTYFSNCVEILPSDFWCYLLLADEDSSYKSYLLQHYAYVYNNNATVISDMHHHESIVLSSMQWSAGLGCNKVLLLRYSTLLLFRVLLLVTSYNWNVVLLLLLFFWCTFLLCNELQMTESTKYLCVQYTELPNSPLGS